MKDFTIANRVVPIVFEELRDGRVIATHGTEVRVEIPDTRGVGVPGREKGSSCGGADRLLDLCFFEE